MNTLRKSLMLALLVCTALVTGGCTGNVGIGLNVGVPVGNHGYMSVGTSRWY
jgi:hypothetical protein